jgi:hypothetical protein
MSENSKPKMSSLLVAVAVADAALTVIERVNQLIIARRKEIAELTPEEDAALEAYEERRFAAWQNPPTKPDVAG